MTLLLEAKSKYTIFSLDDPKSQILYQENDFANYLIMPKIEVEGTTQINDDIPRIIEFDGRCFSTGFGVGVVLISASGDKFTSSFKLAFENTNNIVEYEALLL